MTVGALISSRCLALRRYGVLVELTQRIEWLDIPALPAYHSALLAGLLFRYSVYSYTGV